LSQAADFTSHTIRAETGAQLGSAAPQTRTRSANGCSTGGRVGEGNLSFEGMCAGIDGGIGVAFRYSEGKAYIFAAAPDNKLVFNIWSRAANRDIQSVRGTVRPDEWHRFRISLMRKRIRIELDDQFIFDLTDDFNLQGRVRFHGWGGIGRFRNIKVSAPDGTVLWEGPPELPEN
jgi:hypothetical protein